LGWQVVTLNVPGDELAVVLEAPHRWQVDLGLLQGEIAARQIEQTCGAEEGDGGETQREASTSQRLGKRLQEAAGGGGGGGGGRARNEPSRRASGRPMRPERR